MKLQTKVAQAYTESLLKHIAYVKEAGVALGVPLEQLAQHDISKWTQEEFASYAINFYGSDEDKLNNKDAFDLAWLHHIHYNKHHPQHWILQQASGEVKVLLMPRNYVLEMIADWIGASRAYTGSTDMTSWLLTEYYKKVLHPQSRIWADEILIELGYGKILEEAKTLLLFK